MKKEKQIYNKKAICKKKTLTNFDFKKFLALIHVFTWSVFLKMYIFYHFSFNDFFASLESVMLHRGWQFHTLFSGFGWEDGTVEGTVHFLSTH